MFPHFIKSERKLNEWAIRAAHNIKTAIYNGNYQQGSLQLMASSC